MQLFVRDLSGASHAITALSHADLVSQVTSVLDLDSQGARLSYGSRTVTADTFNTLPAYATVDVSMRLRGGGPKKRCAHVFVKTGTTPSTSGINTPKPAATTSTATATPAEGAVPATEEKKEEQQDKPADAEQSQSQQPPQPVVERCSSAALRMIGDCPRCEKSFCGAHRLPEDHACPALANFRKAAFDENRAKLEKEATISSKISAF